MPPPSGKHRIELGVMLSNVIVLLLANGVTIYLFSVQQSSIWQVLLTYYIQTVFIVYFYYKRLYSANVTQIAYRLQQAPLLSKIYALRSENASEQFLFLFIFAVPLAAILFVILLNYSGNTLFGALPLDSGHISIPSILIGSALFLLHHLLSYGFQVWEYRRGAIEQVTLPIVRISIRVFTLLALLFLLPILLADAKTNTIFYAFMGIKTVLDLILSNSYVLLKDLQRR